MLFIEPSEFLELNPPVEVTVNIMVEKTLEVTVNSRVLKTRDFGQ
jgi:hypothetical protein